MAKTFRCSIVTPTEAVLDAEVSYVNFPAWDGQSGVMAGRSPFLARLGLGATRLDFADGASRWYLVDGGFAQMQDDKLSLLTEHATAAERMIVSDAEAELKAALAESTNGDGAEQVTRRRNRAKLTLEMAKAASGRGGI